MDEYSERFKDTMKAQFNQTFVSSGKVQTTAKEATVTFIKKGEENQNVREVLKLDEIPTLQVNANEIYQIKKAPMAMSRNLYRDIKSDR